MCTANEFFDPAGHAELGSTDCNTFLFLLIPIRIHMTIFHFGQVKAQKISLLIHQGK